MIELLASIARKLHLKENEVLLLHAFNRGWTNTLARRQCYLIVNNLVEEWMLDDRNFADSYGAQLLQRGVLTLDEAKLFSGEAYAPQAPAEEAEAVKSAGPAGTDPGPD